MLTLGNTAAFPEDWLMLHRWGKRRKNEVQKTADGHALDHITVGGRTSCYVPALQKIRGSARTTARKPAAKKRGTTKPKKESEEEPEPQSEPETSEPESEPDSESDFEPVKDEPEDATKSKRLRTTRSSK
jgi:hypothetical protein